MTQSDIILARASGAPVLVFIHGGYWRVPFDIRSTLLYTGLVGIPRAYIPEIQFR